MYKEKQFYVNGLPIDDLITSDNFEDGSTYYYIDLGHNDYYRPGVLYKRNALCKNLVERNLVFKTEESAKQMVNAIFNL